MTVKEDPLWDFYQTSSWINFYRGRDHTARRLGIPEVKKKRKSVC
jgi:methylenetetrahydrofolate reductase (NADPH)